LINEEPSLSDIQLDLVKSRWQENFMTKVNGYDTSEDGHVHYGLEGFEQHEPGLTFTYKTRDE